MLAGHQRGAGVLPVIHGRDTHATPGSACSHILEQSSDACRTLILTYVRDVSQLLRLPRCVSSTPSLQSGHSSGAQLSAETVVRAVRG